MTTRARLHNGRVTVVIPTFNRADLLPRAVDSALAQTAAERCDIVVVDDGSVDHTPEVAAHYAGRLTFVRQRNRGAATARNTAMRMRPNEFTAFLDDDDRWSPEKIERQLAVFARWPAVVLVGGRSHACGPDGTKRPHPVPRIPFEQPADLAPWLFESNFLPTPTVMVRTAILAAAGGFETRLRRCEDAVTWTRVVSRGPAVYLDRDIATYAVGRAGLSADTLGLLFDQLRAWYLLQSTLRRRPDCRAHWQRGLARVLVDLRDTAYRQGRYGMSARFALQSLLCDPWGRSRWEWRRLVEAAGRAVFQANVSTRARPPTANHTLAATTAWDLGGTSGVPPAAPACSIRSCSRVPASMS